MVYHSRREIRLEHGDDDDVDDEDDYYSHDAELVPWVPTSPPHTLRLEEDDYTQPFSAQSLFERIGRLVIFLMHPTYFHWQQMQEEDMWFAAMHLRTGQGSRIFPMELENQIERENESGLVLRRRQSRLDIRETTIYCSGLYCPGFDDEAATIVFHHHILPMFVVDVLDAHGFTIFEVLEIFRRWWPDSPQLTYH